MTFKNFKYLAKRTEIRRQVKYVYAPSYRRILYLLNDDKNFFEGQVERYSKYPVLKKTCQKDLNNTLRRIRFVNKCINNEF